MQGMRFLLLDKDSKPINHGTIQQRITEDRYLCYFTRIPAVSRVCSLDEIMGWNLFTTDELMNEFIETLKSTIPNGTTPPDPAPPGGPQPNPKKDETDVKVETTQQEPATPAEYGECEASNGNS